MEHSKIKHGEAAEEPFAPISYRDTSEVSFDKVLPFPANRRSCRGALRFGELSHHSFFSRHNPHPNRVKHIQGLNGSPVCMVNDDLRGPTPLPPPPFIRSHIPVVGDRTPAAHLPFLLYRRNASTNSRAALLSESWKEELRDLVAKVSLLKQAEKDIKPTEEAPSRLSTQYSAKTGRIIPPPSRSVSRHYSQSSRRLGRQKGNAPSPLYDQELMVLELLCQILQTDSLSQVQQWLLFADQREKDLAMGLLQQAVDTSVLNQPLALNQELAANSPSPGTLPMHSATVGHQRRKASRIRQGEETIPEADMPEMIGMAEVLQVHTEDTANPTENKTSQD